MVMVDLDMPDGLSYEERRRWLKEAGAAIVAETGEPSGQVKFTNSHGRTGWAMWWTEEEYHGPYAASPEEPPNPDGEIGTDPNTDGPRIGPRSGLGEVPPAGPTTYGI